MKISFGGVFAHLIFVPGLASFPFHCGFLFASGARRGASIRALFTCSGVLRDLWQLRQPVDTPFQISVVLLIFRLVSAFYHQIKFTRSFEQTTVVVCVSIMSIVTCLAVMYASITMVDR